MSQRLSLGMRKITYQKTPSQKKFGRNFLKTKGIDAKSAEIGSEADGYEKGMREHERIFYYDSKKNWWSRAGTLRTCPQASQAALIAKYFMTLALRTMKNLAPSATPTATAGGFLR
jgi:hypothetical protein